MRKIPILMYHSISTQATRRFRAFTLAPTLFAAHLRYLREQGYTFLSIAGLAGSELPEKPIILTFDDGFLDFYTKALPLLLQYNATASLFIPTRYLDGTSLWLQALGEGRRPLVSQDQLIEIANAGVDCGAHTHSHCHLDTVSTARGQQEVNRSKEILEQILRRPVTSFAYPYGHYHMQARQWVMDAGFQAACAVRHAISHRDDDPFALARVTITDRTDVPRLAALLRDFPLASSKERLKTRLWRQVRLLRARFERDG